MKILMGRDRYGINPLFYATNSRGNICVYTLSNGKLTSKRYWKLPKANNHLSPKYEDVKRNFKRYFKNAVKRRTPASDTRQAVYLSGGLDSSAVLAQIYKSRRKCAAYGIQ